MFFDAILLLFAAFSRFLCKGTFLVSCFFRWRRQGRLEEEEYIKYVVAAALLSYNSDQRSDWRYRDGIQDSGISFNSSLGEKLWLTESRVGGDGLSTHIWEDNTLKSWASAAVFEHLRRLWSAVTEIKKPLYIRKGALSKSSLWRCATKSWRVETCVSARTEVEKHQVECRRTLLQLFLIVNYQPEPKLKSVKHNVAESRSNCS